MMLRKEVNMQNESSQFEIANGEQIVGIGEASSEASSRARWVQAGGIAVFTLIAVGGLYYVKWDPYFHKAFAAAANHSIGSSILTGRAAAPPVASWQAAWSYALAYWEAIWAALVVGLLFAAGIQALLPRRWLVRVLGHMNFGSIAVAGAASVPSMM